MAIIYEEDYGKWRTITYVRRTVAVSLQIRVNSHMFNILARIFLQEYIFALISTFFNIIFNVIYIAQKSASDNSDVAGFNRYMFLRGQ